MKKISGLILVLAIFQSNLAVAKSVTYVVSPKTFMVPTQSVQGFFDSGSQVAIGRIYNYKLIALGGSLTSKQPNYRWTLLNMDGLRVPELQIDPQTGVVYGSGPAITAGSHKVSAKVQDAAGRTVKFSFLLELRQCNSALGPLDNGYSPCPEQSFSASNTNQSSYFSPGKSGVEFNMALGAVAGQAPYRFSLTKGSLPKGLKLNSKFGIISGITNQVGRFPIEWKLIDANGSSSPSAGTLVITK